MIEDVIYKVLWVDDLNLDENKEQTEFFQGWQVQAEQFNIQLVPFDNWEEAELSLRKDFDEYTAIILDANCKIRKNDPEQEEFITAVLPSLTIIFGEKQRCIPWYLLSSGTMSDFENIVKGASYQHSKFEEDWGEMLYLKAADENSPNYPSRLFENIIRVTKDLTINIVLYRHRDTLYYMGNGKLLDGRARKLMIRMLRMLYEPSNNVNFEYEGNPLRKILEYLFRSAFQNGLLAKECIVSDEVKLSLCYYFMAGKNTHYKGKTSPSYVRWGTEHTHTIFDNEIAAIVKRILDFTSSDSHTSSKEPWYLPEEKKDVFMGYVLHMCHVIKWYGNFLSEHSNIEENQSKHFYGEIGNG